MKEFLSLTNLRENSDIRTTDDEFSLKSDGFIYITIF